MITELSERSWFLQTPEMTYALAVNEYGDLVHWHWGGRVEPIDLSDARPRHARAFTPYPQQAPSDYSLDTVLAEYPTTGLSDFRSPAIEVEHADGSRVLEFKFVTARIVPGKPSLEGLPSTYVESDEEADTLVVELRDAPSGLCLLLNYTVYSEFNVVARSVNIVNKGTTSVRVLRALSCSIDLPECGSSEWIHLSGAWGRERHLHRSEIRPGIQSIESRRGASSHQHNPFLALVDQDTSLHSGEVWAMNLVYSGNFLGSVERDPLGLSRAQIGINPAGFAWELEPGKSFQTPEAIMVYSATGLNGMSQTFHKLYRTRLCRGKYRDQHRPVLLNNWEATYFDFDEERLLELAKIGKRVGVELFVLDDGWFGKRDNDDSSLGDWTPDLRKLPNGLRSLAESIRKEGLEFGLWFEPEMVSPDSDLFRAHPDWILHVEGRNSSLAREQLVLDFSREEVREAIYNQIASILRSAPISYVKWDMNRHLTEVGSAGRDPKRQAETSHRHILGLYAMLETLVSEFPDVLFESCSGGGGRFDPGMLSYMPQTWTSDNTDGICRLPIQRGTSLVYPLSSIAAHISAVPNHQIGRTTSVNTRGLVAMMGSFGLELDLTKNSEEELEEIARMVSLNKKNSRLLREGDLYWLKTPEQGQEAAWMVVSSDLSEAFVVHTRMLAEPNGAHLRLRLRGLKREAKYIDLESGARFAGDALMKVGIVWKDTTDFKACCWHLREEVS